MDLERLLNLFTGGDVSVWEPLCREIERRNDPDAAARVLAQAKASTSDAARWLAHIEKTATLQNLRQGLMAHAQGWSTGPARALIRDILSGSFRLIPAGEFVMGSPDEESGRFGNEAQCPVEISRPFLLKTTPTTQGEWLALMGNNPSHFSSIGADCPVESVNWFDALAYCNALSEKEGLKPCYDLSSCTGTPGTGQYTGPKHIACDLAHNGYRLPTEAEWEYAARAGFKTAFYKGDITEVVGKDPALEQIAWYCENSSASIHPVKMKAPNAWGLCDMLGNVWEWCQDWYGNYPSEPQEDPQGPLRGPGRVLRGGSWGVHPRYARAASRANDSPGRHGDDVGFRPARSVH